MSANSRDRSHARRRREESGVVLILALFVVLILCVIVPQFRFSAKIERELAMNEVADLQMESLARAAILRTQATLLVDLDEDKSEAEGGDDPFGGAGGTAGGASGGAAGGAAGGGSGGSASGGGSGGGVTQHVDSLDEPWATGKVGFDLGQEAELKTAVMVRDEDSKLNVLLLAAEDANYRKEWRDRFERCLDLMRDGQEEDLSLSDASDLVDRFEKWMKGERSNPELETAPLQSGDWKTILNEPTHAPLSLAELALGGGVTPRLLSGFTIGYGDDARFVPGLSDSLTVWSNLEFKDLAVEEEKGPTDVQPKKANRTEAPGVNNGRINVNTAPIWVLKCLFPDDKVPYASWDKYEEFRRDELEELRKKEEEALSGKDEFSQDEPKKVDDKVAKYPFKTIDDLRKVEGFSPDSGAITPETWNKLAMLLTTESNVFTITVVVATLEVPHRYYVARTAVWRRAQGGGDPTCIPLVPFERLSVGAVDLRAFQKELDEETQDQGIE